MILVVLASPVGFVGDAAAATTALDDCGTIDEPGRYELSGDVTNETANTCIEIVASDVILDGQGHTVEGAGLYGIQVKDGMNPLSNVTVRDVTVRNWSTGVLAFYLDAGTIEGVTTRGGNAGLSLSYVSATRVADSDVEAATDGIVLAESGALSYPLDNVVENNTVTGDASGTDVGIHLDGVGRSAVGTTVRNNTVSGFTRGIHVEGSGGNSLTDNVVHDDEHGIVLDGSPDSVLRDNEMTDNDVNLDVRGQVSKRSRAIEDYTQDVDTSNTVDGRPVYYLVGASDVTVDPSTDAGFVAAVSSQGVTVRDLVLSNNSHGVLFVDTNDSLVENVSASAFDRAGVQFAYVNDSDVWNVSVTDSAGANGVELAGSNRNTVESVTVTDMAGSLSAGISLDDSNRNTIANSSVTDTTLTDGIDVSDGHNNTIAWNDVSRNRELSTDGIRLSEALGTTIRGNLVEENSADGISVIYSDRFTIQDNVVRNNDLDGIYLQDSPDGHLCNNTLSGNRDSIINDTVSAYDTDCTQSEPVENQPPTASFTHSPSTPAAGETISLDASGSSDPDGSIASYEWDLDADGQFDDATGTTPTVSFSPTNEYDVSLRVTDDEGATDEATTTVSVLDAETIASCGAIIDSPGLYRLAGDLTDSAENACIVVSSSDVTLDGNGHTVDGVDGADMVGVAVSGSSPRVNVTVRNLTLTDWDDAVWVGDGSNATLQNLTATSSTTGVAVVGGADAVLRDSSISGVPIGVKLDGAGTVSVTESELGAGSHAVLSYGAEFVRATEIDVEASGVGLTLRNGPVTVENVTVNALVTSTSDADVGIRLSNTTGAIRHVDLESSDVGIKAYESDVTVEDAELYDVNTGVELTGGTDAALKNVEVPQGVTGVKLSDAGDVVVDGGYVDVGVHGINSFGAESLQVRDLNVEAGGSGMSLSDGPVTVENVTVNALVTSTSDANVGVSLSNVTGTLQKLDLESADVGVKLYESDATVRDAELYDVNTGIEITGGSNATLEAVGLSQGVTGVKLNSAGSVVVDGGDFRTGVFGVQDYGAEHVRVANATVSTGGTGLYLSNGPVDVENVSVTSTSTANRGVSFQNATGTVDDLSVEAASLGVRAYESNVTIENSHVNATYGVNASKTPSVAVIDTVIEAGVRDVAVDNGTATIDGSWLGAADRTDVGLEVENASVTVRDTVVSDSGTGLTAEDSTLAVENATLTAVALGADFDRSEGTLDGVTVDVAAKAVRLRGSTATLTGGLYHAGLGLEAFEKNGVPSNLTVVGSTVTSRLSVEAEGSNVTVKDTLLRVSPGNDGIIVEASDLLADNVTIERSQSSSYRYGIRATDGSVATIRGGTIRKANVGLFASDTTVDVRDANVVDAYDYGVYLTLGSRATVANSTIRARSTGVHLLNDASVDLLGNGVEATNNDGVAVRFGQQGTGLVQGNDLRGAVGILAESDAPVYVPDGVGVTAVHNDLSNAEISLRNNNGTAAANASLNYYGHRGPAADRVIGHWSPGEPFLTAPPSAVDLDDVSNLQAFGFDVVFPANGTYAFGMPGPTDRTLSETFDDFDGAIYTYDQDAGAWQLADGSESLGALDAVLVVPTTDTRAVVEFAEAVQGTPASRELPSGWNFVAARGYAEAEVGVGADATGATDVLSLFDDPADQPGGNAGDEFFEHAVGTANPPDVSPFQGYFVFVPAETTMPAWVPEGLTYEQAMDLFDPYEHDPDPEAQS